MEKSCYFFLQPSVSRQRMIEWRTAEKSSISPQAKKCTTTRKKEKRSGERTNWLTAGGWRLAWPSRIPLISSQDILTKRRKNPSVIQGESEGPVQCYDQASIRGVQSVWSDGRVLFRNVSKLSSKGCEKLALAAAGDGPMRDSRNLRLRFRTWSR